MPAAEAVLHVLLTVWRSKTGVSVTRLAKDLGLGRTTVRRHLTVLEASGLVEPSDAEDHAQRQVWRHGRLAAPSESTLQPLEMVAWMLAARSGHGGVQALFPVELERVLRRLDDGKRGSLSKVSNALADLVVSNPRGAVRYAAHHADVLLTFLEAHAYGRTVRATYQSPWSGRATAAEYVLCCVYPHEGAIYLVLEKTGAGGRLRFHALHRFLSAHRGKKITTPVDVGAAKALVNAAAGAFAGDPVDVTLRIDKTWTQVFLERVWFPGQHVKVAANGDAVLTATVAGTIPLFRFVLAHAPWVRIIEPVELDAALKRFVLRIWEVGLKKKHP